MSPIVLPQTRSLHRRRGGGSWWWLAVLIAVVVNLGLVIALARISNLQIPLEAPPLAVRSLRQVESEPPPEPTAPTEQQAETEPVDELIPVALPALDLPASALGSDLVLPSTGSLEATLDLPLSVPAFATLGPAGDGAPTPDLAQAGPPAFDTPPRRRATFDLDRYYPRAAKLRGITGSSKVQVDIDHQGRVVAVLVLDSTPPGIFEHAAERMMRAQSYDPATAAGQPVPGREILTIEWTIK